jgi:hypothetical protein
MKHLRTICLMMTILTACGGDAPEDTICEKTATCISLTDAEVDECREVVAMSPSGVLEECADCVSAHSCSEIGNGECSDECAGIDFDNERTRQENAEVFCNKATECGQAIENCVSNVVNGQATDAQLATCVACLETNSCPSIDAGACDSACTI